MLGHGVTGPCAILAAGIMIAVAGCDRSPAGPRPTAVEPDRATRDHPTPIKIHGEAFFVAVHANLDDESQSRTSAGFSVRLAPHPLGSVRYRSVQLLEAVVPAGLLPGTYDLVVVNPRGQQGILPRAFLVLGAVDASVERPRERGLEARSDAPRDALRDLPGPDRTDMRSDSPRLDATPPVDQAAPDGPGLDAPKIDAPKPDAPTPDAPKVDVPKPDAPTPDASKQDAAKPDLLQPDAAKTDGVIICPPSCTNGCAGGVCLLSCTSGCTCPPGLVCQLACPDKDACQGPIDCSQALSCTIGCGSQSCQGNITCGAAPCVVDCGAGACKSISCSGACTVKCSGGACQGSITCTGGPCSVSCSGGSCTGPINCASACSCSVTCTGGSCVGGVSCRPGCAGPTGCVTTPAATCDTC